MKAIFFESHGELDVLKYADLPDPTAPAGHALIKVKAVALNHLDIWVRRGWKGLSVPMPHITGSDISGEIVSVSAPLSQWKEKTKVIINPGIVTVEDEWVRRGEDSVSPGYKLLGEQLKGGLAEYVVVPLENVFKMPDGLSFEEAAAPLLVGTTCWRMLFKRAQIVPGENILVVGSGGGVNSLTIQLANSIGCKIHVVAGGPKKARRAVELGAASVVDYHKNPNWPLEILKATKGRGVDVVIDNVGKDTFAKSLLAVRRGGRIVTVGNTSGYDVHFDNRMLFAKQISLIGSTMGSRQDFIDAMDYLWSRNIKIAIDRVEGLKDGIKMIKYLEEGKQFGKVVLKV